ncbi:hypothetical protein HMPREF1318_1094 [Actinomyces massiliensis F0489]|uniref:Uncharacterized protein n=1 Tax=Actinomyces massiliensis F0489 TaxID=1125718 RepID=J1H170_9ACTO|nr:hypothetical protein HMPREF1318_1094 [Actinomyces massiliensis F0489]
MLLRAAGPKTSRRVTPAGCRAFVIGAMRSDRHEAMRRDEA